MCRTSTSGGSAAPHFVLNGKTTSAISLFLLFPSPLFTSFLFSLLGAQLEGWLGSVCPHPQTQTRPHRLLQTEKGVLSSPFTSFISFIFYCIVLVVIQQHYDLMMHKTNTQLLMRPLFFNIYVRDFSSQVPVTLKSYTDQAYIIFSIVWMSCDQNVCNIQTFL